MAPQVLCSATTWENASTPPSNLRGVAAVNAGLHVLKGILNPVYLYCCTYTHSYPTGETLGAPSPPLQACAPPPARVRNIPVRLQHNCCSASAAGWLHVLLLAVPTLQARPRTGRLPIAHAAKSCQTAYPCFPTYSLLAGWGPPWQTVSLLEYWIVTLEGGGDVDRNQAIGWTRGSRAGRDCCLTPPSHLLQFLSSAK